ncbi:MAG: MBL fold metallo-hydrolase [Duganella sp.]
MKLKQISSIALALAVTFSAGASYAQATSNIAQREAAYTVQLQEIRNATVKVTYGNTTFLVDPLLAKKGAYPGFEGTYRSHLRNPMIELPMAAQDVIKDVDAVIVTHTHLDHWDDAAQKTLPKGIPLFVQDDADAKVIRAQGFTDVRVLGENTEFKSVYMHKIGGQHGTDFMYSSPQRAEILGKVMGVVFTAPGQKTVYIAGDTIWRPEVDQTLTKFNPDVIVLNTGDARWTGLNDPIIMGKEDTSHAYKAAPHAKIVAVHMDAINHTALSRVELRKYIAEKKLGDRVLVPADGEFLNF